MHHHSASKDALSEFDPLTTAFDSGWMDYGQILRGPERTEPE